MLARPITTYLITTYLMVWAAVQIPERNFFFIADSDHERNEWVAAIGLRPASVCSFHHLRMLAHARAWLAVAVVLTSMLALLSCPALISTHTLTCAGRATTESRRVRSYSEEVRARAQHPRLSCCCVRLPSFRGGSQVLWFKAARLFLVSMGCRLQQGEGCGAALVQR